jgi:peptide/nickel transport system permease protein
MRSTTLEVLRQDYMRTARAKGLAERKVIVGHGMRNAMLPVITILGSQFATLIAGTVVIENLFSIPGMGQLLLLAVRNRDFTMVQGIILVYGAILVLVNLVVDLAYAYLDPRIRYA